MGRLVLRNFKQLGTEEYILSKAKLVSVRETGGSLELVPGEKLPEFFPTRDVPLESVASGLIDLLLSKLRQDSGWLSGQALRMEGLNTLRPAGVLDSKLPALDRLFDTTIQSVKLELAAQRNTAVT